MKISVIVPVYNAQNYIERAVDSVRSQSYTDWELILVDDGSVDDSLKIMHETALKDSRITVLTQINAGPAAARSNGVENANGDYLFFLDADDYLPEDALQNLVHVTEEYPYDVVKGLYYNCREEKRELVKHSWDEGRVCKNGTPDERMRYKKIKTSSAFGYLWGTLYKKDFLDRNNISLLNVNLKFMEDTVFSLELFSYEPEYYVLCKPVYCYVIQKNSLSSDTERDFFQQVSDVVKEYHGYLKEKNVYQENLDLLIPLAGRCFSWASISYVTNTSSSIVKLKDRMKEFGELPCLYEILQEKRMAKHMLSIGSKAEGMVYTVFFWCLRWKLYVLLSTMFVCLKGPMNLYIKSALK